MEIKPNNARISKYFDLPPLNQTATHEHLSKEDKYYTPQHKMVCNPYIFGIEIEVENCDIKNLHYNEALYWSITNDNSLRNGGVEFVSLPLRADQAENALTQLFHQLPNTIEFSPRTSIHVHMNVRDLTLDQISCLVILYTAVEDLLFKWVGHNRDQSIFCIKITETHYEKNFVELNKNPRETVHYWNKYTAMNLLPIESKGSIEFRHMEGNQDKERILTWINILSCLKIAAKQHTFPILIRQITSLNTSSEYETFIESIFGTLTPTLTKNIFNLQTILEEPISYIKLALIDLNKHNIPKTVGIYDNIIPQEVVIPQPTATTRRNPFWDILTTNTNEFINVTPPPRENIPIEPNRPGNVAAIEQNTITTFERYMQHIEAQRIERTMEIARENQTITGAD